VNAVAGGGTFLSFGALTLAGLPPISANATSSVAQFPGYITSTLAYWSDIRAIWREALLLSVVSVVGALMGALILLSLDNPAFRAMVPWLLLASTMLFAAGPLLQPRPRAAEAPERMSPTGLLVQLLTAVYGGFFGAGMGIMMLATLGLTERGDYHRLNALKNLLSIIIAVIAVLVFAAGGVIGWMAAAIMVPAVALGGYSGVWAAKRVSQRTVRLFVVIFSLFLAGHYFVVG
jgi:uncharacterized membrane protein YfcA